MTNDRITGPCPECERTRAENARLKSERPYMVDRPYEDLTRLEELRAKLRDAEAKSQELIKDYAEWMSPEDYVPLAQERDALQAEVARLTHVYILGNADLRAENARLREAAAHRDAI